MSSNQLKPTSTTEENPSLVEEESAIVDNSMTEYYQLKQNLLLVTLALTAVIFASVWITYTLDTALNYMIGACVGIVYLGMLAREVEKIGSQKKGVGSTRLALIAGVVIVATQQQQLQIIPIFLGFLTYKAAIIIYVVQTTLFPADK